MCAFWSISRPYSRKINLRVLLSQLPRVLPRIKPFCEGVLDRRLSLPYLQSKIEISKQS